jgi:RND superfamily putative drug exporter
MQLLGRGTWWVPDWLDRLLPRLDVEPVAAPPPVPARMSNEPLRADPRDEVVSEDALR